MGIHVDIGGEGRYPGAVNVNPGTTTSTTGAAGRPIPNLVMGVGERLPIRGAVADLVTVESAPLRPGAIAEIERILAPGGTVRLVHPLDFAVSSGVHDAVAGALGPRLAGATSSTARVAGVDMLTTTLRAVSLLR